MSCTWTTIGIYYNKLQKTMFQNSFIWKKKMAKRTQSFFLVIMLAHCIMFAPLWSYCLKNKWLHATIISLHLVYNKKTLQVLKGKETWQYPLQHNIFQTNFFINSCFFFLSFAFFLVVMWLRDVPLIIKKLELCSKCSLWPYTSCT
jgi:hypothetical protein